MKAKPREDPRSSGGYPPASWKAVSFGQVVLAVAVILSADPAAGADLDGSRFRIGFSPGMFTEVSLNDARAAVKVWAQTIAKERGIATDPDSAIFADFEEMSHALRDSRTDAVGMTVVEYEKLRNDVPLAPLFFTMIGGSPFEQYLLLVASDSGIEGLGQLQGRSIVILTNVRSCVVWAWLDALLIQKGFRAATEFFGSVSPVTKPSQAGLPVFFRKSEACVLTRSAYATMCELNPQLARKLKILESSVELVPVVFALRGDYDPPFKDKLLSALRTLHETPAGQQVLTVFLADRLEERPESILQSAVEIIKQQRVPAAPPEKAAAALLSTSAGGKGARVR